MKIFRSSLMLLLILVVLIPAAAQEKSLLWKVSGNNLSKPSFVFGTMHILCAEDFEFPGKLQSALNETEVLVLELDPTDPKLAAEMQTLMVNPGMQNIYTDLGEADYALINGILQNTYGAGLDQMGVLKPMVITTMVMMAVLLPCEDKVTIDGELAQKARETEKEIVSLETAAFQMALFDQIPSEIQIGDLIKTLGDDGKSEFEALKKAYLAEDIFAMEGLMDDNEMMSEYGHILLGKRNAAWLEVLPEIFQKQASVVAVGAGHLPGEDGLLNLLKEAGFTVEPVY